MDEQFSKLLETITPVEPYNGSYDFWLVATSVSIAILAAFVALSISSRMANAPSWRFRWAWASAGALSTGGGIWAMHFIGMLAFSLPCGVSYDPLGTLLSMVPGIIASGVALHVISRVSDPGPKRLLAGAVLIGAGIGAMHYSGMAAMRPDATLRYQPGLVAVSVVVAVVLAFVALEARFQLRRFLTSDTTATLVAAILLGLAVSGMHYTAMQASAFYPLSRMHEVETIMPPSLLAALITVISVLIAAIALVSSVAGRQWELASGLSSEIARRRALEQEAESGRARLQAIFDAVADAIITMDRAGHIKQWSSGAQRIFGYAPEEIANADIAVLMPDSECSSISGLLGQLSKERIVTGHELTALRKDGSQFPAELALSEVRSGDEVFFTAIVRDITERKRAEADLVRARKQAEAANLAKSQFLATMSHEIRTPINGVLGMAHLLTSTALNVRQRRLLDNVVRSGQALLGIINDILDFAKIEAGKLELSKVPFEPREAIAELADLFSERCANKGLEFVYFVAEDVPTRVIGDPVRLRQILVNLVGNAVKFTEAGEVVVKVTSLPGGADEAVLSFTVEDTGIGIAPEQCSRIFEPFHQVDSSMTRAQGGSGLGLAISRQLVELMGGSFSLQSEPGRGSCFGVTAHFNAPPHAAEQPHPRQHLPHALRALVVDGNAASANVISLYLANWQIDARVVQTVAEAEEALSGSAAAGAFDVAIIDVKGLDVKGLGQRVLDSLRSARVASGARPIELVLLVSLDTYVSDTRLEAIGAAAILPKPVRPSELFNALVSIASDDTRRDVTTVRMRGALQSAIPTFSARVLVAEDNAVHQEVAIGMLEAMGCRAVSVSNGQLALDMLARERFDLILMDCEMPVMDGIEATRRIRGIEVAADRGSRMPIIALTAHALSDVRDKCFDAGMDGFLIKPFDARQLADALKPYLARSNSGDSQGDQVDGVRTITTARQIADVPVIDTRVLDRLRTLGRPNGSSPLGRAVACFVDIAPSLARDMRASFESGEAEELWRSAHSLKSSSGALGATVLAKQCAQIEAFARQSNLAAVRPLMEDLDGGVTAAVERLQAIAGDAHVPA